MAATLEPRRSDDTPCVAAVSPCGDGRWKGFAACGAILAALALFFLMRPTPPAPPAGTMPMLTVATLDGDTADLPPRPQARQVDGGEEYDVLMPDAESSAETTVWVYLPAGKRASGSLPAVFIAPSGTNMLIGASLSEEDAVEHLPYVQAGFAVVAYSLWGAAADDATDEQVVEAMKQFRLSGGGLEDAQRALRFVLARFPEIDRKRLYLAGHASAGTAALHVAAAEPAFAGCAAYAPEPQIGEYQSRAVITVLEERVPGTRSFAETMSPMAYANKIKRPVFLFQAADDKRVTPAELDAFAKELRKTNSQVTLVRVPAGGHRDAMLKEGIPAGIAWLRQQAAATTKPAR